MMMMMMMMMIMIDELQKDDVPSLFRR